MIPTEMGSYQESFLSKEDADALLEWCREQKVIEYPFRGKFLKRSPKLEWGLDETIGTYRWGQEKKAYSLVQSPFPPLLEKIRLSLQDPNINHVILIRYDHGKQHHIPWHSDKQEGTPSRGAKDIRRDTNIYNVVVCTHPRRFQLAYPQHILPSKNGHGEATEYVLDEELQHGSLLVLTAKGNREMKHRVPKEKGFQGIRFSIVFRCMKRKEEQLSFYHEKINSERER